MVRMNQVLIHRHIQRLAEFARDMALVGLPDLADWHVKRILYWINILVEEDESEAEEKERWADEHDVAEDEEYVPGQPMLDSGWRQDETGTWYPPKDGWKDRHQE